jgi:ferredoxin-NADP reductase
MAQEVEVRVKEVIQRNYNVKSVRLDLKETQFLAGQFMQVEISGIKRYLSISSSPTEKCYLEFTKKITESDFSRALQLLKSGDSVRIKYPMGKFTLEDNPSQRIAFLSGGIGITPIRSIVRCVVDKNSGEDIILVYANRSIKDIVFKDDLNAMQRAYAKLRVAHVLCEADPGFKCTKGMINAQVIRDEVADYPERRFFLCGPPQMVEAMRRILGEELKVSQSNIVTENFQGY